MSIETRTWVCSQLAYTDNTQQSDLMNPNLTTTELIAFLVELLYARGGAWQNKNILVTAVRTDHPTQDGPDGHSGGNAIDFADNNGAPGHLLADVQSCEQAKGIGCGGEYQQYAAALGGYSAQSKLFEDNSTNHVHVQVLNY